MTNSQFYQVVTLELADGRKVTYTGQYALKDTDRVIGVTCSPAHQLPHGMTWERMVSTVEEDKS